MNDLKTRILGGGIFLILLYYILNKGNFILIISLYLLSIIGLHELFNAFDKINLKAYRINTYFWTLIYFLGIIYDERVRYLSFIGIILTSFFYTLKENNRIEYLLTSLLGFFYIPFLISHLFYLTNSFFIWLVFLIAFGTDTMAYLIGNLFGEKKLAPKISPNKSVEGFIGGLAGSSIFVFLYCFFSNIIDLSARNILVLFVISIIGAVIGQLGDLSASKIKRATGIKDFGKFIPGHGGFLDRFDSVLFIAPYIYIISKFIIL